MGVKESGGSPERLDVLIALRAGTDPRYAIAYAVLKLTEAINGIAQAIGEKREPD